MTSTLVRRAFASALCGVILNLGAVAKGVQVISAGLPSSAYYASSAGAWGDGDPAAAFNGGTWNARAPAPQWIEVDLGTPYFITGLRATVEQSPAGRTDHRFYVSNQPIMNSPWWSDQLYEAGSSYIDTYAGQVIDRTLSLFDPSDDSLSDPTPITPEGHRYLQIRTYNSNTSWVAWTDIEVLGIPVNQLAAAALPPTDDRHSYSELFRFPSFLGSVTFGLSYDCSPDLAGYVIYLHGEHQDSQSIGGGTPPCGDFGSGGFNAPPAGQSSGNVQPDDVFYMEIDESYNNEFDFGGSIRAKNIVLTGGQRVYRGDANFDQAINGLDYQIWRSHYGLLDGKFAWGDFTLDRKVTAADYTVWADHYGESHAAELVPEPSSWNYCLTAIVTLGIGVRRFGGLRLTAPRRAA